MAFVDDSNTSEPSNSNDESDSKFKFNLCSYVGKYLLPSGNSFHFIVIFGNINIVLW